MLPPYRVGFQVLLPYPSPRLIALLGVWAGAGLPASLWPELQTPWGAVGVFFGLLALADARLAVAEVSAGRKVSTSLSLGEWHDVNLTLHAQGTAALHVEVFDDHPVTAAVDNLPQRLVLLAKQPVTVRYRLRPQQRGTFCFGGVHLRVRSAWGLWQHPRFITLRSTVRVYPNFAAIAQYTLLATANRLGQLGIRKLQRRGEGLDFYQLREYRQGDSLRQIDWNATARQQKTISKEYQDERDQQIVCLLDCGQRMMAQDGALAHFDHTLNALILLAYVALRQGDALGLLTFSGEKRWLAPGKGVGMIRPILNTIYDLQPTLQTSDYLRAAEELMARQRRRALVILVSNLRDQESDELLPALQLLRKKHLVLLASLQETVLNKVVEQPPLNFDDALRYAATLDYLHHRRRAHTSLQRHGIVCLDTVPEHLPVALINRYLDIKRSGRL